MKERPIIFSGEMVRAILAGAKTQTRRMGKESDTYACLTGDCPHRDQAGCDASMASMCPYGLAGQRLWVREAWWDISIPTLKQWKEGADTWPHCAYDADENDTSREQYRSMGWKLRSPIFMPRWASRITLEITDVRVQRVQEISEEDVRAEGVSPRSMTESDIADMQISDRSPLEKQMAKALGPGQFTSRFEFQMLWDSINAKRGFGWNTNPWVWALTFRRVA